MAAFVQLSKTQKNLRLLVVVPTIALQDQWFVTVEEDLGIHEKDIKILTGKDLNPNALVNIVVINTARKFNHEINKSDQLLLVVDECHRAGSAENAQALVKNTFATLGLSATPFREFDDGFKTFIEPIMGGVFYSYTLKDAISDGILADLEITNIRVPLLPSEESEYVQLTSSIGRAYANESEKGLVEALLRKRARLYNNAFYRIPTVVSILERQRKVRTIVFLESIDSANLAKELLEERNHLVTIYHSEISEVIRRSNLRMFRRGLFDILIACRALDEGFNVPEASLALIAAGTSSKRQRIQRMGRVLRSMAGKEKAQVVTLYATDVEEVRLVQEAEMLGVDIHIAWQKVNHDR
jgi:superfamily II DNA or RNA helicase